MTTLRALLLVILAACAAPPPHAILTQIGLSDAGDVTNWHEAALRSGQTSYAQEGCALPIPAQTLRSIEATLVGAPTATAPPAPIIASSTIRIHLPSGGELIFSGGGLVRDGTGQWRLLAPQDRADLAESLHALATPHNCGPLARDPL